ncbi:NEAT domain-containing protein [Lactiplantibacillus daowaiensis]|uniref:NEAT domain-containing protein n=1 Tax=Lactiplantibacillus daowaiensis TaxID=2559918 RepID=A0ABW1S2E5_9LACO|nr:NEAT domain-containing protein [Lactiplantibacillus daowaiensis]
MRHQQWIKVGLGGLMAVVFLLLNVTALHNVQAATLADGTYQLPASFVKDDQGHAGSVTSSAASFFNNRATVVVSNDNYQVTLPITTAGQKYITGVTSAGKDILTGSSLTIALTSPAATVPVTFNLTTPMGAMTESAWLTLDWQQVPTVAASTTSSSAATTASSSASTTGPTTKSSASSTFSTTSSSVTTTKAATQASQQTAVTKATTTKTTQPATTKTSTNKQAAALTMTGWTYQVLQATGNQVSAANKFYTHTATIIKTGNQYQVRLNVRYAKSTGMAMHGFTPLTINGETAQNIHYATSGKNYVVTYTFTVKSLQALTKLISGTVHVTVPAADIDQTFTVRFKFSHAGTDNAGTTHHATTNPQSAANTTSTPATTSATKTTRQQLPQTKEATTSVVTLIGFLSLGLLSGGWLLIKWVV